MKRYLLIFTLCFGVLRLYGQVDSTEAYRQKGFQARLAGDYALSIQYYENVLKRNPNDYDATLAIARLYSMLDNFDQAIAYYQKLLDRDARDWEALHGMGNCYLFQGKLDQSIDFHHKAIEALPNYVPGYLALAKALSWKGSLDEAIRIYQKANKQDSTYAEVWSGLGKMYYWKGMPYKASAHYKKALELDPTNVSIQTEYQKIEQDTKAWFKGQFRFFQEREKAYVIDALIQQYTFSKKMSDHFHFQVNTLLDYSDRAFTQLDNDTTRWFLNSWVKLSWMAEHHRWGVYAGYSPTDNLFSSYGLSWQMKYKWGAFSIANTFNAGYEYFFYWNNVGRNIINESLQLKRNRWESNLRLSLGLVDEKPIRQYSDQEYEPGKNPFIIYSVSLSFLVIKDPIVKIGGQYSLMDFDYQSIEYYSPYDRKLSGIVTSIQKKFKHLYFYASCNYNMGTETYYFLSDRPDVTYESDKTNVNNWSAGLEVGYIRPTFSVSINGSRFENPFYENWIGFLSLSKSL